MCMLSKRFSFKQNILPSIIKNCPQVMFMKLISIHNIVKMFSESYYKNVRLQKKMRENAYIGLGTFIKISQF